MNLKENAVELEPQKPGPLMCSFCARLTSTAGRLVAGPGVAICRDCAEASVKLFCDTDTSQDRSLLERMTDVELLAHLPEIAAVSSQVEEQLRAWVGSARQRTISWTRIGTALGMTRQSAWERFQSRH